MISGTSTTLQLQNVNAQKSSEVTNINNHIEVQVDGGNFTPLSLNWHSKKQKTAGDSIYWMSPSEITGPYTVSFVKDKKIMTDSHVPFMV